MDLEQLLASLAEIDNLDNDALGALGDQLRDAYKTIRKEPVTSATLEQLSAIAEGLQTIDVTIKTREEEQAQIESQLAELDAAVIGEAEKITQDAADGKKDEPAKASKDTPVEPAAGEPVAAGSGAATLETEEAVALAAETEPVSTPEPEPEGQPEATETATEPETVVASLGEIGARQPDSAKPKVTNIREREPAIFSVEGRELHRDLDDPRNDELAKAFAARLNGMGRVEAGYTERVQLAYVENPEYDPSGPDWIGRDERENQRRIQQRRRGIDSAGSVEAFAAAGGINAPRMPIYDIYHVGISQRPLRDSMTSFNADRGGVRIVVPTPITSVGITGGTPNQAMENVTAASDASGHTKVYQEFSAPSIVDYDVEANPLITQHGNMSQRFFPEEVQHDLANSEDMYARFSENLILTKVGAGSTAVTKVQVAGAATDVLNTINRTARQMRNRHRTDPNAKVRVWLPDWVKGVFQRDIALRTVANPLDTLMLTEAQVNAFFNNINVNVTWFLDGVGGSQIAPPQLGSAALNPDPTIIVWYMFFEGTWLYLDGGQLDLGVVRDSTLNSKNKYQIFREEFWNLAFQGLESLKVTQTFCANGGTSGTITPDNICDGGS